METIAVCICTYKRPQMLRACLTSIGRQIFTDTTGIWVKVIVIDNDAQRTAENVVAEVRPGFPFSLTYKTQEKRGIAAARNAALDVAMDAGAKWIAFIDDDETAHRDWLNNLMQRRYRHVPVLAGRREYVYPTPLPFWCVPKDQRKTEGQICAAASTCNVRFSAALVCAGLRFDETFGRGGGSDTIFFTQAHLMGFEIRRTDAAITYETVHSERLTFAGQLYREYSGGATSTKKAISQHGLILGSLYKNLPAVWFGLIGLGEMALAPAFIVFGLAAFKGRTLSGGRKAAKALGRIAGMLGHTPQIYAQTVGH